MNLRNPIYARQFKSEVQLLESIRTDILVIVTAADHRQPARSQSSVALWKSMNALSWTERTNRRNRYQKSLAGVMRRQLLFDRFDRILAMDEDNLSLLQRQCPEESRSKLGLFLAYAPDLGLSNIPDPYYGAEEGFERVLELCELAAGGLLSACEHGQLPR